MKLTKALASAVAFSMLAAAPTVAEARWPDRHEHRDEKTRNTLIGAGIGLLGGAIISGGDPWATLGGAAAGGVIGNVATNERRDRDFRNRNYRDRGRNRRGYDYRR